MAHFGFGTYRISEHNPKHIEALREAIKSGITLIDTSTNYMNGEAQRAIAQAMKSLSDEEISDVEIVSKVGYIPFASSFAAFLIRPFVFSVSLNTMLAMLFMSPERSFIFSKTGYSGTQSR